MTWVNADYADAVAAMEGDEVLLLENLRFNPGEEKNDEGFAKRLATLGDIYASMTPSLPPTAPMPAPKRLHAFCLLAAGRLMAEELGALEQGAWHTPAPSGGGRRWCKSVD